MDKELKETYKRCITNLNDGKTDSGIESIIENIYVAGFLSGFDKCEAIYKKEKGE